MSVIFLQILAGWAPNFRLAVSEPCVFAARSVSEGRSSELSSKIEDPARLLRRPVEPRDRLPNLVCPLHRTGECLGHGILRDVAPSTSRGEDDAPKRRSDFPEEAFVQGQRFSVKADQFTSHTYKRRQDADLFTSRRLFPLASHPI